ncbi:MAG: cyclic dehypoxanthinyl futalosine synthase [bacterium]|nr:dehypoxanthine futalosine cyclase [bacterium]MBU1917055.1 dehypoxanthine futalosine cyclase [bacterium]
MTLLDVYNKSKNNQRLTINDALLLAHEADFLTLAQLANERSKKINGNCVAYLIDCNINYTNICINDCTFCAFSRHQGDLDAWTLSFEDLDRKIDHALSLGAKRVLLQGGLHPEQTLQDYVTLIEHIKNNHAIHIHAFSPPEIHFIAKQTNVSVKEVIEQLINAGLQSIPGGGAEILVDDVREQLSEKKINSETWLAVMGQAHEQGLKTTATMMFGHIEGWEERVMHLEKLRDLQDRTEGFSSFIPWTFQMSHTPLKNKTLLKNKIKLATANEYLRLIAISRLFLDNIKHIQASLLTQGDKIAQLALNFGADDLGSIMIEENVVAAAGCNGILSHSPEELVHLIHTSGHKAYERDTYYNEVTT